jgi:NADH-quinone oxidoreductase subunit I
MYGQGIAKGLWVTFKHFFETFADDIRYAGRKYLRQDNFEVRQGLKSQGAFTVQYPDEKLAVPERFRFVPFLITEDEDPARMGEDWCTSCGICAKVCPPQCIWIVRGSDPNTGRPVPQPTAFFIDIDICMNCGFCAEFCPFDAIKMDHDYELASYDRTRFHIHDKQRLSKPQSYWKNIAPTTALEEAIERGGWDHTDVLKAMKKAGKTAEKPSANNMFKSVAAPVTQASPAAIQAAAPAEANPTAAAQAANTKPATAEAPTQVASESAVKPVAEGAPASAAQPDQKVKFDKQAMLAKIRDKKANRGG